MIDQLNAPLLSLTSLPFLMTFLATPRVKYGIYSFANSLILLSITLAIFNAKDRWLLIGLLAVQTLPLAWEIQNRRRSSRVYWIHMSVFIATLIGNELLVDSAIEFSPWVGFVVVSCMALNGIGIMRAYFRIFTGVKYESLIPIASMRSERIAILTITLILIGGGLLPQLIVNSRYKAAVKILQHRTR